MDDIENWMRHFYGRNFLWEGVLIEYILSPNSRISQKNKTKKKNKINHSIRNIINEWRIERNKTTHVFVNLILLVRIKIRNRCVLLVFDQVDLFLSKRLFFFSRGVPVEWRANDLFESYSIHLFSTRRMIGRDSCRDGNPNMTGQREFHLVRWYYETVRDKLQII